MSRHFNRIFSSYKQLFINGPKQNNNILKISNRYRKINTENIGGPKEPGKGKGPITWKSLSICAVGGAGVLAFFYYVKNEKDMGECYR